jgi:acyl-CoA thioesterase I
MMLRNFYKLAGIFIVCLLLVACGDIVDSGPFTPPSKKPTKPTVILIFGDSISQGYGTNIDGIQYQQVTPGKTYAELLRQKIQSENIGQFAPVIVVNESLGSEYTEEALYRLPGLLAAYKPTHVLLAHGTNDAGSDLPNSYISGNLSGMVAQVRNSGAKPLLADVTFTRYGPDIANAYSQMIVNTAYITGATYVGLLKGVVGNPTYYLTDGVHFNDAAQPTMMTNLWEKLNPLFD